MNRRIRLLAAVALALALAACKAPDTPSSAAKPAEAVKPYALDPSGLLPPNSENKAELVHVSGDYTHVPTGLILPARAGRLVRVNVAEYDDERDDVSANYTVEGAERKVLITAYVFPVWNMIEQRITLNDVPMACEHDYQAARSQMVDRLTNPSLVNEADIKDPRFKDAIVGRMVAYDGDKSTIGPFAPLTTSLYFQCGIDKVWIVQYRITYARDFDAEPILRDLLAAVPSRPSL